MRQIAFDEYYLTEQDEPTVRQLAGETCVEKPGLSAALGRVVRIRRRFQTIRRVLGLHG